MEMVYFNNRQGELVAVDPEQVTFCPAVYGIFIESHRVLLNRHPETGLWQPPGGLVEIGQIPGRLLRSYFRSATGLIPDLGPLLYVEEQHQLDSSGRAWQLSVLYYALSRPAGGTLSLVDTKTDDRPVWLLLSELSREQMQFGYQAIVNGANQ